MIAMATNLLRVSHVVDDVGATAGFYVKCLGLESSMAEGSAMLAAPGNPSGNLRLELRQEAGARFCASAGYQGLEGAGYQGLMARVPSISDACEAAMSNGGAVLRAAEMINHGASLMPEENEEEDNPVLEALVADPSGYPLLLHECDGVEAACLSGVRIAVHEWKKSQEWYEKLGLHTVRWNSNVHREASLTITLGGGTANLPVGPRGYLPPSNAPVLQLMYIYGASPVKDSSAVQIVLATDEAKDVVADPDAYQIVCEPA